jgi:hypothetical protein
MTNNSIYNNIKNFLQQDEVGPFLLMVNALVYLLTWISIGNSYSYLLALCAVVMSCGVLYRVQKEVTLISAKSYTIIGVCFLMMGLVTQAGIQWFSFPIIGRGRMMLMMSGILLLCYMLIYCYLYLVRDGETDIIQDDWKN